MPDGGDPAGLRALHAAGLGLVQQHRDQVLGRAVAEQLALVLFVEGNAVARGPRGPGGRSRWLYCPAPAMTPAAMPFLPRPGALPMSRPGRARRRR
jgi:hypothetical protein